MKNKDVAVQMDVDRRTSFASNISSQLLQAGDEVFAFFDPSIKAWNEKVFARTLEVRLDIQNERSYFCKNFARICLNSGGI
ncbi:hypothetical protein WDW89_26060 [Deltaproteobacteria bacterium TL4]